jgi:hypothetical protein
MKFSTTIVYKQKCLFVNEGQEGKTRPIWGLVPVEGGRHKDRVKGGNYGRSTMYSCMKIEQ